jgi:hypothetical protein
MVDALVTELRRIGFTPYHHRYLSLWKQIDELAKVDIYIGNNKSETFLVVLTDGRDRYVDRTTFNTVNINDFKLWLNRL